ncbi:MAG: methyltransferase domain-containing protein, partial [Myxococcales bacterium]|nr:methyltransferase domain-containing protein [Myxococcales bacterium]
GAFLEPLALAVGPEGKLYAVDIVPSFLEHLRRRADEAGLGNVEVVAAGERDVMLPADSVDLLFVCDVYHHLEYPAAYLRTLHRALRADGRLVIVEFDKVPGKTTPGMMKHVRQDRATLLQEVGAEGFVLEREVDSVVLDENYMLVFRK